MDGGREEVTSNRASGRRVTSHQPEVVYTAVEPRGGE